MANPIPLDTGESLKLILTANEDITTDHIRVYLQMGASSVGRAGATSGGHNVGDTVDKFSTDATEQAAGYKPIPEPTFADGVTTIELSIESGSSATYPPGPLSVTLKVGAFVTGFDDPFVRITKKDNAIFMTEVS